MLTLNAKRWSGLVAVIGGVVWMLAFSAMALRPSGIPGGAYRQTDDLAVWQGIAATFIAISIVGYHAEFGRVLATWGRLGLSVAGVGSVFGVATGVAAALTRGEAWLMPFLVIPAVLVMVVGSLLFGVAILQQAMWPRWPGALLVVAALLMFCFNSEDWRACLAVPFGLAWAAVGVRVWLDQNMEGLGNIASRDGMV
jgi:hypothetical protein